MGRSSLSLICPHCEGENPAFEAQRCRHCGLNMRSDREHLQLQQKVFPLVEQVETITRDAERSALQQFQAIQPLLAELTPYARQHDFLEGWLKEEEEKWAPVMQRLYRFRQMLMLHLAFLFLLCLVPLVAWMMGASNMLMGLLCLPVFGWGYLGVWGFVQRFQSQSFRGEHQE
ncbi:MAG: hypothetical protein AAFR61_15955 [Bacteroidota bacterium]